MTSIHSNVLPVRRRRSVAALFAGTLLSALALGGAAHGQDANPETTAIFAGGCFWCVESDFDKVAGVTETVSGYIGGSMDNPTYQDHVSSGHREAVKITFDPAVTDYETLLATFWRTVDPTDGSGQFCDRGFSYSTAVYALDDDQAAAAEASKAEAESALGQSIVTPVEMAPTFWPAEEYHQDYYQKNEVRYRFYRQACGRDRQIQSLWGDAAMMGVAGY